MIMLTPCPSYTILLYEQPSTFAAPAGFQQPLGVTLMDLASYVKDSNLGPLVAVSPCPRPLFLFLYLHCPLLRL